MKQKSSYSYAASVKSDRSDEFINTYLIRPLAGLLVRLFFYTPITPNQVTVLFILVGFLAAYFYLDGTAAYNTLAGLSITLKDILDSADGQLARAKERYSRMGRFLDSLGDFLVNLFVFAAITCSLFFSTQALLTVLWGALAFTGLTLRVSYHVFYQTSFLHLQDKYVVNRVTEEIREADLDAGVLTFRLQQLFQLCYGWQDRLMVRLDAWSRGGVVRDERNDSAWFGDAVGLRLSGLLGLGTELFVLMLFSIANRLEEYLCFNLSVMNGVLLTSVFYRKAILTRALTSQNPPAYL